MPAMSQMLGSLLGKRIFKKKKKKLSKRDVDAVTGHERKERGIFKGSPEKQKEEFGKIFKKMDKDKKKMREKRNNIPIPKERLDRIFRREK